MLRAPLMFQGRGMSVYMISLAPNTYHSARTTQMSFARASAAKTYMWWTTREVLTTQHIELPPVGQPPIG